MERDHSHLNFEPSLDELLAGETVQAMMRRDGIDPDELRALILEKTTREARETAGAHSGHDKP